MATQVRKSRSTFLEYQLGGIWLGTVRYGINQTEAKQPAPTGIECLVWGKRILLLTRYFALVVILSMLIQLISLNNAAILITTICLIWLRHGTRVILKSWILLICVSNTVCMHDYSFALMQAMCWQKLWNLYILSQIVSVTLLQRKIFFKRWYPEI